MDLKIRPFKKLKKNIIKGPLPNIIPRLNFRLLVSGATKSGKSTTAYSLITDKRFYYKFFDIIILFSKTLHIDDIFRHVVGEGEKFAVNTLNATDKPTEAGLIKIYEEQEKITEEGKVNKMLIIFDDCIGDKILKTKAFENIFYRGRHINISIMVLLQKYNAIPRGARLNCSDIICFRPQTRREMEIIAEENACEGITKKRLMKLIGHATSKKYNFCYIRKEDDACNMVRKNFDEHLF